MPGTARTQISEPGVVGILFILFIDVEDKAGAPQAGLWVGDLGSNRGNHGKLTQTLSICH